MKLSLIILYLSILIWLLPPFRQFRGRFFYYFLLQAIADPISLTLMKLHMHNLPFYVSKDILLIISLWRPKLIREKIYYIVPLVIIIFFITDRIYYPILLCVIAGAHMVVLYFILVMLSDEIFNNKRVKMFFILIVFYELTILLKYIFAIVSIRMGITLFYLTTAFELILGVSFVFIAENNARMAIKVKE